MKAPFSLKGAVLQWFMNALFVQTSEIYYSESLRAFFHSMSLTSVLHPWRFLYKHCSWFILRVNDLQCTKYNEIAVSSEGGLKITGIALTSGKEQKCLCKSVLGAHLGTPLTFFIFRCSQWLAAGGQPKHRWAGFISESTWIVTGPDPVLLLQSVRRGLSSVAHSPSCAVSPCNEATHHRLAQSLKDFSWKVPIAHGWRRGLPCSWQRWALPASARNQTGVENYSPPWSDLVWKSGVSWLLTLVGGIFICGMPFLQDQRQSSEFHMLAFSCLALCSLSKGKGEK